MGSSDDEVLDHAYLTIDDFLNSRHIRSDDIDHGRSADSIQFHFNKPGFDLAVIITHKSLIPTIAEFQVPFQSKHSLTTHVIYLSDVSRLKFCIRDLKLHEILYAIIVSLNSKDDDEYDVFCLSEIIEHQRKMSYKEAIEFIRADFDNYMNVTKEQLNKPEKSPHPKNRKNDAFIEPSKEVRHLLCLLFDHRVLEPNELRTVSNFIRLRKDAISRMGNRIINYDLNDRPMPSYRQDKFKYYIYECKPNLKIDAKENLKIEDHKCQPMTQIDIPSSSIKVDNIKSDKKEIPRLPLVQSKMPSLTQTQPPIENLFQTPTQANPIVSPNSYRMISPHKPNCMMIPHSQTNNVSVQPLMDILINESHININAPPDQMNRINPHHQPIITAPQYQQVIAASQFQGHNNSLQYQHIIPASQYQQFNATPQFQEHNNASQYQPINAAQQFQGINNSSPQSQGHNLSPQHQRHHISPQYQQIISSPQSQGYNISSQYQPIITAPQSQGNNLSPQHQRNHISQQYPIIAAPLIQINNVDQQFPTALQYRPTIPSFAVQNDRMANNIAQQHQPNIAPYQSYAAITSSQQPLVMPYPFIPNNIIMTQSLIPAQSQVAPIAVQSKTPVNEISPQSPDQDTDMRQLECHTFLSTDYDDISSNESVMSNDSMKKDGRKIEIDLTDDVINEAESSLKDKTKLPSNVIHKPNRPLCYIVNFDDDCPALQPKICKVSSNGFVNILKFVLYLSPFSLPPQNVVMTLIKKCVTEMEAYIADLGLESVNVDIRSCRTDGCSDIIRIIELLCGEAISYKHSVSDLSFMWTYFPKGVSQDSITVMFYKLMKMLELSKLMVTTNEIVVSMLQNVQKVVNYNFLLSESNCQPYNILNFFPTLFTEYFGLRAELHHLSLVLPAPDPLLVTLNKDLDKTIVEHKIKFVVGPLIEYFIGRINSIPHQLDIPTMEVIHGAMRSLRFCLRKICVRLLPDLLTEKTLLQAPDNIMSHTLDEINLVLREVSTMNCILFTKKHYEFVNVLLDFAMKIEKTVTENIESELELPEEDYVIHLDPLQFLHEFATTIKTAVLAYHPDTEIDSFKRALKNRWIDTLHQAFKGVQGDPDGSRIAKEMAYLLPKCWARASFDEAVLEAATLSYTDWDKMLTNDFSRARLLYSEVRNNYLLWLSNHRLDHRKAMESMTSYQRLLDAKVLQLSS